MVYMSQLYYKVSDFNNAVGFITVNHLTISISGKSINTVIYTLELTYQKIFREYLLHLYVWVG